MKPIFNNCNIKKSSRTWLSTIKVEKIFSPVTIIHDTDTKGKLKTEWKILNHSQKFLKYIHNLIHQSDKNQH